MNGPIITHVEVFQSPMVIMNCWFKTFELAFRIGREMLTLILLWACDSPEKPNPSSVETVAYDRDGDGYFDSEDCDDSNSSINPDELELCDGLDNNCDGQVNEGIIQKDYSDNDADGFGDPNTEIEACSPPTGHVSMGSDCDDNDDAVFPEASNMQRTR